MAVALTGSAGLTHAVAEPVEATAIEELTLNANADTYVQAGSANRNQGGAQAMRVQPNGDNRALVRFDQTVMQSTIGSGTVISAKLRLMITANNDNWGPTGRTVDVHRLIVDWAEGNGTDSGRGTGAGATWNCAIDSQISNQAKDCSGATEWEMGQPTNPPAHPWVQAPTASLSITNGLSGLVEYDVTADVTAFLGGTDNDGWIMKKTNEGQSGMVGFGTKDSGAPAQLVITYNPPPLPPPVATTRVFPTSSSQQGVVIDGPYGYVASYNDYEVVKVRLADGVVVGRFPTGASFPIALTILGGDLYVANYGGSNVVRMRTFDGAILNTYPTDDHPATIGAYFGKLWVGNWDNGVLRAIDPVTPANSCVYSGGGAHLSVTADAQYVYTVDPVLPGIRAVDPTSCAEVSTSNVTLSSYPSNGKQGIGFDGTYLWAAMAGEDRVVRIDLTSHAVLDSFTVTGTPVGVAFDGLSTWVLQSNGQSITRLYTSTGNLIETIPVDGQPHTVHATNSQILIGVWAAPNTLLIELA